MVPKWFRSVLMKNWNKEKVKKALSEMADYYKERQIAIKKDGLLFDGLNKQGIK